jgi:hypothetical protein
MIALLRATIARMEAMAALMRGGPYPMRAALSLVGAVVAPTRAEAALTWGMRYLVRGE